MKIAQYFKEPIYSIKTFDSSAHQIKQVTLVNRKQWIIKKFAKSNWLGFIDKQQISLSQQFSKAYDAKLSYKILRDNEEVIVIYPYQAGKGLKFPPTAMQAYQLGKCLAQLHQQNFKHPAAKCFPSIHLPLDKSSPSWLFDVINQSNHYISKLDRVVVSHRDLHLENIIWTNEELAVFIDWESAGFIHPGIELVGLAANCAGVADLQFNKELYVKVLKGYFSALNKLPNMGHHEWLCTWHSWLLWEAFQLKNKQYKLNHEFLFFYHKIILILQDIYASYC